VQDNIESSLKTTVYYSILIHYYRMLTDFKAQNECEMLILPEAKPRATSTFHIHSVLEKTVNIIYVISSVIYFINYYTYSRKLFLNLRRIV
jgi:hypothetical protein